VEQAEGLKAGVYDRRCQGGVAGRGAQFLLGSPRRGRGGSEDGRAP